jgi:N-acetylglucosaminyldiphosphoundecaprenol N-acetyl-beta-D-mannosaminyltransferase
MLAKIKQARPDLLLVALGSPKQELWIDKHLNELQPAVAVAVGAGLDFVAGTISRAPPWISKLGMEWLYRMAQEPRRLWRRYLVNDPKFLKILWRAWKKT